MSDNDQALLPCPFCGSDRVTVWSVRDGQQAVCKDCKSTAGAEFHGRDDQPTAYNRAIAAWNRRATSAEFAHAGQFAESAKKSGPTLAAPAADEPVGLREAVYRFLSDYDDGDRADAGNGPLMELHIAEFRQALATPARTDDAAQPVVPGKFAMLKTLTDADIARDGEMASVMVRAGLLRDLIDCATQAPGGGAAPMRQIVAKLAKADCECDAHHGVSNCLSCQARALPQEVEPAAPVKRDLTSGERIEQAAQWLHDEGGFGDAWPNHTWPEHPDDTGQRDGGFVKIVPSDVQAKFREVATRMLRVFPEALSTQAAYPTGAGEGLSVADAWQDLVDKDDRTSPEEYPDMALITREELADYMQAAVTMKEGE